MPPPLQAVSDAARKVILTEYDNDKNQAESNDYSQFSNWADAAGESVDAAGESVDAFGESVDATG